MRANKRVISSSIVGLLIFGSSPISNISKVSGIRLRQTNPDFSFKISILDDENTNDID